MLDMSSPPAVVTQEVRVVDAKGQPRIVLSAGNGTPTVTLLRADGEPGVSVKLDMAGRPTVMLVNPNPAWPNAALEIDDMGAHVKFDRPGGASSYLFLNNAGGSGVVLIDPTGKRRVEATVDANGSSNINRFGDGGKPIP